jgi:cobalt-zinc-cadmium resistance protein CzcA
VIEALVRFAVARRGWVLGGWLLVAAGLAALAVRLKLDALPDITSNQVQVLTRAPGLTPEEVEQRVTRPLEASFGGTAGLVETRSLSRYGLSAITLVFEDDVDLLRARQLVAERMASSAGARAPGVEPPELGPITGGLGEVFHFTVSCASRTPAELLELVQLRAAPILKTVPGIVEVNTWGGATRTFEVRAAVDKIVAHGISFDALKVALERTVGSQPGAALETGDRQMLLRGRFLPSTPTELADALVAVEHGTAIRVGDVATVAEGAVPRLGAATRDGRGETVYVMAQMLIGANAREVTEAVRSKLGDVRAALPSDVQLDVVYDRSELVNATLRTVARSLLEGGLLVSLVLFLMLGSARAGLVVALTIPVAMLGATAAMTLLGVSGNLMSLGAVDFGLLVDGAVVLVEYVFHQHAHEASDEPWHERVASACAAVARPSFFGVLVIMLVYVPVLSLTGVDGKLFRPMAVTVVLALLTALLFSLTFVPAASAALLRARDVPSSTPRLVRIVEFLHDHGLHRFVAHPLLVLGGALTALALSISTLTRLGSELAPTLDEGALVVQTTRHADIGIAGAIEQATRMEAAMKTDLPEVRTVVSRIGSPAVATDTMGLEQADVFVELAPHAVWRPGMTHEKLLVEVAERIERETPGSEPAFTQPIQMRFNELLGGAPFDVVVSVLGQDRSTLQAVATDVLAVLAKVRGVEDPRVLAEDDVPLRDVRPNSLAAAQRGMRVGDVLDLVGALRLGIPVGTTYDGPREIPVTLRLGTSSPEPVALATTLVPGPRGEAIPLDRIATVEAQTSPAVLFRFNGERRMLLGFNVRGRELGEVVLEAQTGVEGAVKRRDGARLAWGGQFETLAAAKRRLGVVIPGVLVLIAFVLFVHFRKRSPILWVLAHVPFAAVGGVFALAWRGMALSVSAGIGFIALWGIAVMNGTVLVTEIERLEAEGMPSIDATLAATRTRTRPVSMTALVAALGFLPMALATGVGAEIQRPLATVVIGGLLTSTSLTLLVLPALRVGLARVLASRVS